MSNNLVYITEIKVKELLDWNSVSTAVESALIAVSEKRTSQKLRTFTPIPNTNNSLLCMPGYLRNKNSTDGTLVCKMISIFPECESSISANIALFDDKTGALKCMLQGSEITAWRTAAASVIATKCLHFRRNEGSDDILAILGAGIQGRIHAIAFQHFFKFKHVHIWNRSYEKGKKLADELMQIGIPAKVYESVKDCIHHADVIVTATGAVDPVVRLNWVKHNVHINALGVNSKVKELEEQLYHKADVYVDHMETARADLKHLLDSGVEFKAEIGDLLIGNEQVPESHRITVFQSLGMAVEDAAVAQLIYDRYVKENTSL